MLLTNGFTVYQLPYPEALGLDGYFDHVFTTDRLREVKPCREAFDLAFARACRGRPSPCKNGKFLVGDRLVHDVGGANRAGVVSIWFDSGLPSGLRSLDAREPIQDRRFEQRLIERLTLEDERVDPAPQHVPDHVIGDLREIEQIIALHPGNRCRPGRG